MELPDESQPADALNGADDEVDLISYDNGQIVVFRKDKGEGAVFRSTLDVSLRITEIDGHGGEKILAEISGKGQFRGYFQR